MKTFKAVMAVGLLTGLVACGGSRSDRHDRDGKDSLFTDSVANDPETWSDTTHVTDSLPGTSFPK